MIIGAGSTSFIILRSLVQKLPVMTTPKWVSTRTQPIAVSDVIRYFTKAKCLKVDDNLVVDIGSEQMSFKEMLHKTAKAMGLMRFIVPVPVLTPRLSSYWVILFSPVPFPVASALIEGLRSETVIQNDNAKRFFPDISPVPFDEAVRRAIAEKP